MVRGILDDSRTFSCLHGGKIDYNSLVCGYLISMQFFYSMEQREAFSLVMKLR